VRDVAAAIILAVFTRRRTFCKDRSVLLVRNW